MKQVLYEKVIKKLDKEGIEVLNQKKKDSRSSIFRFGMWLVGRPLKDIDILEVKVNGKKKKLAVVNKSSCKREFNKIFKKFGSGLAQYHNIMLTGKKLNIHDNLDKRIPSLKKTIPKDMLRRIKEINHTDLKIPQTYIHNDINLRHMTWNNNKPGFIDWARARYGNPLRDFHYIENSLKKSNSLWMRLNLVKLYEIFKKEYFKELEFEVSDNMFYLSRLTFLAERIESKPKRAHDNFYKKEMNLAIKKL